MSVGCPENVELRGREAVAQSETDGELEPQSRVRLQRSPGEGITEKACGEA